jgi:hypothetical protein
MDNPDFNNATFDIHYVERLLKAEEAARDSAKGGAKSMAGAGA